MLLTPISRGQDCTTSANLTSFENGIPYKSGCNWTCVDSMSSRTCVDSMSSSTKLMQAQNIAVYLVQALYTESLSMN